MGVASTRVRQDVIRLLSCPDACQRGAEVNVSNGESAAVPGGGGLLASSVWGGREQLEAQHPQ